MAHWQPLPDTLDPDVRRLVEQLRLLKDRSGRSLQSLAEATACSKSAWQRYLNGTKFPPRAAVAGLGRLTGADAPRLMVLWEVAEAAWIPEAPLPAAPLSSSPLVPALRPAPAHPVQARPGPPPPWSRAAIAGGPRLRPPLSAGPSPLPLVVPEGVVPDGPRPTPRRPLVPVFALAGGALLLAAAGAVAGPALWAGLVPGVQPAHRADQDAVPAGRCSGASCQGRDPYTSGCEQGATVAGSVDVDSLIIQLRYSRRCGAVWTRAQGGTLAMTLRSLSISGDNGSVLSTLPRPGAAAPVDHSPILAAGDPSRAEACAVVDDVQACAGADDPGGPPHVLTYLPGGPG